jgi:quercetin dioxygenase-like cupin family protein
MRIFITPENERKMKKIQSELFFNDADTEWEVMWEGIRRKIMGYDGRLMLVKVKFEKGAVAPVHHHPHSQSAYIVEGEFEVEIGNQKKILSAGDGFYIPPDVAHGVIALESGVVIDSFSPVREDFLNG